MSKCKPYTKLPCDLRLRLDVVTGGLDLVGNLGAGDAATSKLPNKIRLNIVSSPGNLMALSAFFLARAQERQAMKK